MAAGQALLTQQGTEWANQLELCISWELKQQIIMISQENHNMNPSDRHPVILDYMTFMSFSGNLVQESVPSRAYLNIFGTKILFVSWCIFGWHTGRHFQRVPALETFAWPGKNMPEMWRGRGFLVWNPAFRIVFFCVWVQCAYWSVGKWCLAFPSQWTNIFLFPVLTSCLYIFNMNLQI